MKAKLIIIFIQLTIFPAINCSLLVDYFQTFSGDYERIINESFKYNNLEKFIKTKNGKSFAPYSEDKGLIAIGGVIRDSEYGNNKIRRREFDMKTLVKLGDIFSEKLIKKKRGYSSIKTLSTTEVRQSLGLQEFILEKVKFL